MPTARDFIRTSCRAVSVNSEDEVFQSTRRKATTRLGLADFLVFGKLMICWKVGWSRQVQPRRPRNRVEMAAADGVGIDSAREMSLAWRT